MTIALPLTVSLSPIPRTHDRWHLGFRLESDKVSETFPVALANSSDSLPALLTDSDSGPNGDGLSHRYTGASGGPIFHYSNLSAHRRSFGQYFNFNSAHN